jgi:hypothetical protein
MAQGGAVVRRCSMGVKSTGEMSYYHLSTAAPNKAVAVGLILSVFKALHEALAWPLGPYLGPQWGDFLILANPTNQMPRQHG